MNTGDLLRKHRLLRKLKQDEVADYLHLSQRAYSKLETGETPIRIDTLQKIAELFKVELTELIPYHNANSSERAENGQNENNKASSNLYDKSIQLYEKIISRQQEEIDYLKGIIGVLK